jgi:hypothetical protein
MKTRLGNPSDQERYHKPLVDGKQDHFVCLLVRFLAGLCIRRILSAVTQYEARSGRYPNIIFSNLSVALFCIVGNTMDP